MLDETTQAYAAPGAAVNSSITGAGPNQTVNLLAADTTYVASLAGTNASGQIAGVGAGADVGSITKHTEAYVAGTVNAADNVLIQAESQEVLASMAASNEVAGAIAIAAAGSVYTLHATTKAYIADGAAVLALGNVLVAADDSDHLDMIDDLSNSALIGSVGASLGVAVVSKDTEAYVGHAVVDALGNAPGIAADDGSFTTTFVADTPAPGHVSPPGIDLLNQILNLIVGLTAVQAPAEDPAPSLDRVVTPPGRRGHRLGGHGDVDRRRGPAHREFRGRRGGNAPGFPGLRGDLQPHVRVHRR